MKLNLITKNVNSENDFDITKTKLVVVINSIKNLVQSHSQKHVFINWLFVCPGVIL